MFSANLVIQDQICDELLCGQGKVHGQTDGRTDRCRQRQYPFGLKGHMVKNGSLSLKLTASIWNACNNLTSKLQMPNNIVNKMMISNEHDELSITKATARYIRVVCKAWHYLTQIHFYQSLSLHMLLARNVQKMPTPWLFCEKYYICTFDRFLLPLEYDKCDTFSLYICTMLCTMYYYVICLRIKNV